MSLRHHPLIIVAALAIGILAAPLAAQHRTVTGHVVDAGNKERLPFAAVSIAGTRIGVQANVDGFFALRNVPDSAFILVVRYVGYAPAELPVEPEDELLNLVVKLRPSAIGMEGVTVTGARTAFLQTEQTPSAVTVSPRLMTGLPVIGQADIFRSLQLLPGISATNDGSSGLSVRGGTPDQNLILFDGMTVYQVDHFFGFFSAFNPDAIKDIRLYKGAFPSLYGGRLSSVIDIVGRSGNPDKLHGKFGLSLLSADALVETPLLGATLLVAARRSYSDIITSGAYNDIYRLMTGSDAPNAGTGPGSGESRGMRGGITQQSVPTSTFSDINAKLSMPLSSRLRLSLSYFGSSDDYDLSRTASSQNLPTFQGPVAIPSRSSNTRQGNNGGSARLFAQWSDDAFSDIVVAYNRYASAFTSSQGSVSNGETPRFATDETNSIDDATVRIDNTWNLTGHQLAFGAELAAASVKYSLTGTEPNGSSRLLLDQHQTGRVGSMYVQDTWSLTHDLRLVGGLRVNSYSVTGRWHVEPRLSVRYALTEALALKAAWGLHSQYVNRILNENVTEGSRDFWLLADARVPVSTAMHLVAGATWENEWYTIDIEGFAKDIGSVSEFTQRFRRESTDLYTFLNGTGRVLGLEVLLQKRAGMFNGWISYTLSRAEKRFSEVSNGAWFPSEYDQTHEVKLVGTFNPGNDWTFGATFVYATGKPYTAPISQYSLTMLDSTITSYTHVSDKNAFRLPAYHRLDVSITKKFRWEATSLDVGVSVFNVYDRKNISYYQYELDVQPIIVTEVAGLGILPSVFMRYEF